MSIPLTAFYNVNGPCRKWYRLIQSSWSPYDIYTASTNRLGVVITQDNWPIALVSRNSPASNQWHHYRIRTLSQKSSAECCGDTNIRLYKPYLIRYGWTDTKQSNPLNDTWKGICPEDHQYVRIHNTVADATMFNKPKVNLTIEYNHACMWVHEREGEPEMTNVLKDLVVPQKASQKRPRRYKHDSDESSIPKSQQRGV